MEKVIFSGPTRGTPVKVEAFASFVDFHTPQGVFSLSVSDALRLAKEIQLEYEWPPRGTTLSAEKGVECRS